MKLNVLERVERVFFWFVNRVLYFVLYFLIHILFDSVERKERLCDLEKSYFKKKEVVVER